MSGRCVRATRCCALPVWQEPLQQATCLRRRCHPQGLTSFLFSAEYQQRCIHFWLKIGEARTLDTHHIICIPDRSLRSFRYMHAPRSAQPFIPDFYSSRAEPSKKNKSQQVFPFQYGLVYLSQLYSSAAEVSMVLCCNDLDYSRQQPEVTNRFGTERNVDWTVLSAPETTILFYV